MESDESSEDNYYKTGLISKIREDLYVTDVWGSKDLEKLKSLGITRVISIGDMSEHKSYSRFKEFEYMTIVMDDTESEDIAKHFTPTHNFIATSPGPVLVHCWAGISRSVAIVIAHLILSEKKTYLSAFYEIKKVRPFIRPNIGFIDALGRLERNII
jgi:dual specificity phosphatase 12